MKIGLLSSNEHIMHGLEYVIEKEGNLDVEIVYVYKKEWKYETYIWCIKRPLRLVFGTNARFMA